MPSAAGEINESAPGRRRVSRRDFLGLAVGGLLLVGCEKERIVYIEAPAPTPAPPANATPITGPQPEPTPAPKSEAKPEANPSRCPIQLPIPVVAGPDAAVAAQSQVIPPLHLRD